MPGYWTWDGCKRDAPGVILFVGAVVIMLMLAANSSTNDAIPIRSVSAMSATVKSAQSRDGKYMLYVVFLHDGSSVVIGDDRPHIIGSDVTIERVTRDNGFVFYRFPE